jgi:glycosyltransferase involved in cell wall biosynthesis
MAVTDSPPFFSVIISTRDRPELFQTALGSVLEQTFAQKEILVVVDGSSDVNLASYRELQRQHVGVTFLQLVHRANGHGSSYTMNFGAQHASGRYLCFLDDDDYWTDAHYLEHVASNISAAKEPVQVHYSNQRAVDSQGIMQTQDLWLGDLVHRVTQRAISSEDCYRVDAAFLLSGSGFAHLNCSTFERDFYQSLGGMDECIRYENDRDIFIRSIDAASVILFSTRFTSLHNIPDTRARSNLSTVHSSMQKKLYQLRVYDKGISLCKKDEVIKFCCRGKTYELKHTAALLAESKQYKSAAFYARAALSSGFNFRWLAYTLHLTIKSWFTSHNKTDDANT